MHQGDTSISSTASAQIIPDAVTHQPAALAASNPPPSNPNLVPDGVEADAPDQSLKIQPKLILLLLLIMHHEGEQEHSVTPTQIVPDATNPAVLTTPGPKVFYLYNSIFSEVYVNYREPHPAIEGGPYGGKRSATPPEREAMARDDIPMSHPTEAAIGIMNVHAPSPEPRPPPQLPIDDTPAPRASNRTGRRRRHPICMQTERVPSRTRRAPTRTPTSKHSFPVRRPPSQAPTGHRLLFRQPLPTPPPTQEPPPPQPPPRET